MFHNFISSLRLLPRLLPACLLCACAWGANGEEEASQKRLSDDSLSIRGILNIILPGTEREDTIKLDLHPHFGDLVNDDNFRTFVGLTYSITNRWEAMAGTEFYFSHGLGDMSFGERVGLAEVTAGTKYRLGQSLIPGWEAAVGGSYTTPVFDPPPDTTDGLRHVRSYITFARPLKSLPKLRVFWSLGTDFVTEAGIEGEEHDNDIRDDASSLSAGVVYEAGRLNYTLEATWDTTRLLGDTEDDVVTIRPGFVWDIPNKWVPFSKGKCLVGLAAPVSFGPDGASIGLSAKIRIAINFRKLLGHVNGRAAPAAVP